MDTTPCWLRAIITGIRHRGVRKTLYHWLASLKTSCQYPLTSLLWEEASTSSLTLRPLIKRVKIFIFFISLSVKCAKSLFSQDYINIFLKMTVCSANEILTCQLSFREAEAQRESTHLKLDLTSAVRRWLHECDWITDV